jgi:hypothetical protein
MNLDEQFTYDTSAFEDGTWVRLDKESAVKVRSPQSAHSRALRKKLEAPYVHLMRGGKELPEDVAEDLLFKQMSQSLIMDWKGIKERGVVVDPTPASIEAMLRKYTRFRDMIGGIIANADTYATLVREEDLGN